MGKCRYCGISAGFLNSKHDECEKKYQAGKKQMSVDVYKALRDMISFDELMQSVAEIQRTCFVSSEDARYSLIRHWEANVEEFLNDGILDKGEDERLIGMQNQFNLTQEELNRNGAYMTVGKASVLRDVLNGERPRRKVVLEGNYAPNLQKSEYLVWVFHPSEYLEDKIRREIVGRSKGISVRIMKGVYYRIGDFKGRPVEHTDLVHLGEGMVALTNKHIFFLGPQHTKRIPYRKVISFEPFDDGIGINLDGARTKRIVLKTGDGWLTYNLVTNLSSLG